MTIEVAYMRDWLDAEAIENEQAEMIDKAKRRAGVVLVTQADAKSLAVAYEAFCEANRDGNAAARKVWADILLRDQERTGVILASPHSLAFFAESK